MHYIAGHVIYLYKHRKNYGCQAFLLKFAQNVASKREFHQLYCQYFAFITFLCCLCESNVQVTKLCMNSVLCIAAMAPTSAIISNAVARWRAMHVGGLQSVHCIHITQN